MLVKELRKALKRMPGEMPVYSVEGTGFRSAKHIFKGELVSVPQWCELCLYTENHTPQFHDSMIERETGFKNREELIAAYNKLTKSESLLSLSTSKASLDGLGKLFWEWTRGPSLGGEWDTVSDDTIAKQHAKHFAERVMEYLRDSYVVATKKS